MKKFWEKFSRFLGQDRKSQTWTLIWGALLLYVVLAVAQAIWQNYSIEREIVSLQKEISALREEKQSWLARIAYYKTDAFKEREARRKLNYQKSGEKVLIIPKERENESNQGTVGEPTENERSRSNILKWWDFLFG